MASRNKDGYLIQVELSITFGMIWDRSDANAKFSTNGL